MKKRLFALCLALTMAASAVSCGDSDDSSKTKSKGSKSDTSSVSQTEDSSKTETESKDDSKSDESVSEESTPVESEPEPAKDEKYAYYDLLDAEYQKYGKWSDRYNIVADGCLLIADDNGGNPLDADENGRKPCLLIKEDGSSIDLRKLDIFKNYNGYLGLKYAGGFLYNTYNPYLTDNETDHFAKIDMNGKVVRNVDLGKTSCEIVALSGNGDAVLTNDQRKSYMVLKNDSDTVIEMPKLLLEGEHGLSIEPSRIEFIKMFYNSKIYVWAYDPNGNEFMYYFDFDDLSWHECEKLVEKNNSLYSLDMTIGRYAFFVYSSSVSSDSYIVYDMETNTVTEDIPYVVDYTYYGGDFNIDYSGGKWVKIKIPSDAQNFLTDREIVEELADAEDYSSYSGKSFSYMSNSHYLYRDSYGLFVRSFEKGKDDEKTIVLFENK